MKQNRHIRLSFPGRRMVHRFSHRAMHMTLLSQDADISTVAITFHQTRHELFTQAFMRAFMSKRKRETETKKRKTGKGRLRSSHRLAMAVAVPAILSCNWLPFFFAASLARLLQMQL